MIEMTTDDLLEIMNDAATYPFEIVGNTVKFYDEQGDETPLHEIRLETSYAKEDLQCVIEDLACWVVQYLDGKAPLIFRNLKIQEQLYKTVDEYKEK